MASAFQDADAFRGRAAQVFAARWADDVHGRLRRTEEELAEARRELDTERTQRVRLEERLASVSKDHAAQDRLKLLGGAAIGLGGKLLFDGRPLEALLSAIAGLMLAFGIPWWRRDH